MKFYPTIFLLIRRYISQEAARLAATVFPPTPARPTPSGEKHRQDFGGRRARATLGYCLEAGVRARR